MEVRSSAVKQSVAAREELTNNEEAVLGCLRGFTSLNGDLGQLERLLYEQTAHLPRPIFKFFRKIRQDIEQVFNTLESYSSATASFAEQKDRILQQQIKNMEADLKNEETRKTDGHRAQRSFPPRRAQIRSTTTRGVGAEERAAAERRGVRDRGEEIQPEVPGDAGGDRLLPHRNGQDQRVYGDHGQTRSRNTHAQGNPGARPAAHPQHGEEAERRGAGEERQAGLSGARPLPAVPVAQPRPLQLLPQLPHLLPLLMIPTYIQLPLLRRSV